jgi:hypothetical protein
MANPRQAGFNPQQQIIKLRVDSYDQQRQADPSVDAINKLSEHPLLNSTTKEGVSFTAPATGGGNPSTSETVIVKHSLGRAYRGWYVTCITRGDAVVFEVPENDRKDTELRLRATVHPGTAQEVTFKVTVLVF